MINYSKILFSSSEGVFYDCGRFSIEPVKKNMFVIHSFKEEELFKILNYVSSDLGISLQKSFFGGISRSGRMGIIKISDRIEFIVNSRSKKELLNKLELYRFKYISTHKRISGEV